MMGRFRQYARITAWSKSGCSNSFMGSAFLRLPLPSVWQGYEKSKIEAEKRIEAGSQPIQRFPRLTELLPDGSDHGRARGGSDGVTSGHRL